MNLKIWLIAFGAISATLFAPTAHAQDSLPHAEECTTWGFIQDIGYEFGVVNTCTYTIEVWFLSGNGAETQGQVAPGHTFSTGLTPQTVDLNQWLAAVCRAEHHPNVTVSAENGQTIVNSQYVCMRN